MMEYSSFDLMSGEEEEAGIVLVKEEDFVSGDNPDKNIVAAPQFAEREVIKVESDDDSSEYEEDSVKDDDDEDDDMELKEENSSEEDDDREEEEGDSSDSEVIYYVAVDEDTTDHKNDSSPKQMTCPKCEKRFSSNNTLIRHLQRKHLYGQFKCRLCKSYSSTYADAFFDHYLELHPETEVKCPKPKCRNDERGFESLTSFSEHYLTHSARKRLKRFVCDVCGKAVKGQSNLNDHMNVHTGAKPYKCNECDYSSTHGNCLSAHKKKHLRAKGLLSHMCEICGKSFSSAAYAKEHKLIKHEGKKDHHKCKFCDKVFTNISTMARHRAKYHRNDSNTTCQTCGYVASFANELRKHEKTHQAGEFPCRFCGKILKSQYSIAAHERIHTGVNPYHCQICNFSCKSSSSLWRHKMESHEEARGDKVRPPKKMLPCPMCEKEFSSRDGLNNHLNIHTGNRPYKCDECDYTSTHRAGVFMHKKKHAGTNRKKKVISPSQDYV